MIKEIYDSIQGIESTLDSYHSFESMINERRIVHYKRKEELERFIVFESILLDQC